MKTLIIKSLLTSICHPSTGSGWQMSWWACRTIPLFSKEGRGEIFQ